MACKASSSSRESEEMKNNSLSKQQEESKQSNTPLSCPENLLTSDQAWNDYRERYDWALETCKAWLALHEYIETQWDAIDDYPAATLTGFQLDLMRQLRRDVNAMVEANERWERIDERERA